MTRVRLGLMRRVAIGALLGTAATVGLATHTSWASPSTKGSKASATSVATAPRKVVALTKGSTTHPAVAQYSLGPATTPLTDAEIRQMFTELAARYGFYDAEPEYALAFTLSVRNWRARPYGSLELLTPRAVGAQLPSASAACLLDGAGDFALHLQLQSASLYLVDCTLEPVAGAAPAFFYQVSVTAVGDQGALSYTSLVPLTDGHVVVGFPVGQAGRTVELFFDGQGSQFKYLNFRSCRVIPSAS